MADSSHARLVASATPARGREPRRLQRKCAACSMLEEERPCETCRRKALQRRTFPNLTRSAVRSSAPGGSVAHALHQPGRPLDTATRGFMEQRFANSFADVRIHDDSASADASHTLGAEAFTFGAHVHFAAGRYRPSSRDGLNLLAHELTHTIQQRSMRAASASEITVDEADSPLEREADRAAERIVAGIPADISAATRTRLLQRKGSAEVEAIDDLLSYGIFDWAITDAEAVEALTKLKGLPRIEQAEFMSDPKYANRLRDNLPDNRIAEFDAIAADVKNMLPANSTVEAIIDKLSYGLFDWAITDKDATEALDLLKTLSGEELAIALKRINYGRLMDNLPESRRRELIDLLAAGLGTAGTFPTSQAKEPGTVLRSLDFVSDHGVMRDNSKDWSNEGKAFPQPDWTINAKGETRGDAISHTMGEAVAVDLGFDVKPENAPASGAQLTGKGSAPFLDFDFSGSLQGGAAQKQRMVSANKIPDTVAAYPQQTIDWSIKWGNWQHAIGTTGPFDIYATIDKPKRPDTVTTNRMAKSVELVSSAPTLKPHDVVQTIMFKWTRFNLDVRYTNEWDLAADMGTGAQCIDLVRFVQSVIGMVGLPGQADAVIIWATPQAPNVAIETPFGQPGGMSSRLYPSYPGQPGWQAALLDGDFRPNNFEAALKFTADGQTKYYPGGVQTVFEHADDVLTVFNCLAWFTVAGKDSYRITNVPGPYRAGQCKVGETHTFSGAAP